MKQIIKGFYNSWVILFVIVVVIMAGALIGNKLGWW